MWAIASVLSLFASFVGLHADARHRTVARVRRDVDPRHRPRPTVDSVFGRSSLWSLRSRLESGARLDEPRVPAPNRQRSSSRSSRPRAGSPRALSSRAPFPRAGNESSVTRLHGHRRFGARVQVCAKGVGLEVWGEHVIAPPRRLFSLDDAAHATRDLPGTTSQQRRAGS